MMAGAIRLDGAPIKVRTPSEAIAHGIYLVPEDRKQSGLLLDFAITDNISLPDLPAYAKLSLVSRRRETANAERPAAAAEHPRAQRRDAGRRRCPAATSRRWCSPNGCR